MSKMRIVHLLCMNTYSGAENVVCQIIDAFKYDDKIEMIYVSPRGSIEEILKKRGINYYPIQKVSYREVNKVMKILKPDIVHAHDLRASILASLCKLKKCISHLHKNDPSLKKISVKSVLYFVTLCRYSKVLIVSKSIQNEFIFSKVFKSKFICIGNPVSIEEIREKSLRVNDLESYDLGFIGRFEEPKNPLLFINIVNELVKSKPDIKTCMVGEGSLLNKAKELIVSLNLRDNIVLKGFNENPYSIMKNIAIICIPSIWEGFGLVAVEAMSLEKPVVCSGVGGLSDIVHDTCGKICNTTDDYVREIIQLLNNEEYYLSKKNGAAIRSKEFNNIKTYKNALLSAYYE